MYLCFYAPVVFVCEKLNAEAALVSVGCHVWYHHFCVERMHSPLLLLLDYEKIYISCFVPLEWYHTVDAVLSLSTQKR